MRPPSPALLALEGRAWLEFAALLPALPLLGRAPAGDGHPVLVLPGWLANDRSTQALRWFLRDRGYHVHGWKLGRNLGPSSRLAPALGQRFTALRARHGRKLSLIGWSLGGIYARELARRFPDDVRQVITLASPFRDPSATSVARFFGSRPDGRAGGFQARLGTPLTRRTNNLAAALRARGGQPGDKVALYLRNRPEYLEATVACFKARLVHVNVNFRYLGDELRYIMDDADAKFVVFAGEFAERLDALRPRLPRVQAYIQLDDGSPLAPFAAPYEPLAAEGRGAPLGIERSPDDLLFLYTGGTTGMPKGVMWRSEDLWRAIGGGGNPVLGEPPVASLDELAARVRARGPGLRHLPACPLMHGTGLFTAFITLTAGGSIATLGGVNFDPHELWHAVGRHAVNTIAIVGDAFAKPMLRALDERRGEYRLDSLISIISSGVMWPPEVKRALLAHD